MGIIYLARCKVNGKGYVGETIDLDYRKKQHMDTAFDGGRWVFSRAIRKYGWDAFEWLVLYQDDDNDREWMGWWERKFIKELGTKLPNGYNMTDGGEGGDTGISEDGRRRLSEFLTGRILSEETKEKLRQAALNREPVSKETGRKISLALTGKKRTEEQKSHISESLKGKKKSGSHKQKLRQAALKQFESEEARFLAGNSNRGKKMSEEQKEKIRTSIKETLLDPELRQARSERMRLAWQDPEKRELMLEARKKNQESSGVT